MVYLIILFYSYVLFFVFFFFLENSITFLKKAWFHRWGLD